MKEQFNLCLSCQFCKTISSIFVQSVHKTILFVILHLSISTRAKLGQEVKHTYSSGTLMFLEINDFFACQDNNSLIFMFIEFRRLFASIHKQSYFKDRDGTI